jgi:hypothetical protein
MHLVLRDVMVKFTTIMTVPKPTVSVSSQRRLALFREEHWLVVVDPSVQITNSVKKMVVVMDLPELVLSSQRSALQ